MWTCQRFVPAPWIWRGIFHLSRNIFAIIKDGYVPSITVDAKGKSLADLGNLNAYTIEGHMRKGKISLTYPSLNLDEVEGSALISKGVLSGQRLRAKLSKIKGERRHPYGSA